MFTERIYKDGTSKEVGRHKPEWHGNENPAPMNGSTLPFATSPK
ncbi:MAG: hypothetical protein WBE34_10125 [Candidatus Nitrosopolaris sp.]